MRRRKVPIVASTKARFSETHSSNPAGWLISLLKDRPHAKFKWKQTA